MCVRVHACVCVSCFIFICSSYNFVTSVLVHFSIVNLPFSGDKSQETAATGGYLLYVLPAYEPKFGWSP